MPKEIMGQTVYTIDEAAAEFGVTVRTMHKYIKSGRVQGQKIGGAWHFTEDALKAFVRGDNAK